MADGPVAASFRDPSGFVFKHNDRILRQVNHCYRENYDRLMSSGLYTDLVERSLLLAHTEAEAPLVGDGYKVIAPQEVPFISYPYEWCFGQLKDAAQATLAIQQVALEHGMVLKDASAYNIQFVDARPVMIDTLSFEEYREGEPWIAYGQFCQHFLAPLALMSYRDFRLARLLGTYIDGVPLDLASGLLPRRSWLRLALTMHVHLHARSQGHYADRKVETAGKRMSQQSLRALVDNLESGVRRLEWRPGKTEWSDYYDDTNYDKVAEEHKGRWVQRVLASVAPEEVWDLGANVGRYSRLASQRGIFTVAFDVDPAAVQANYSQARDKQETNLLPLVLDLTNPSPSLGWAHEERGSLADRGRAGLILALALVHHLAISNNVPLERIAEFLSRLGDYLAIEFVPKTDSQAQRLLAMRPDIFPQYTKEGFEAAFAKHFHLESQEEIRGSERVLYLMRALRGRDREA